MSSYSTASKSWLWTAEVTPSGLVFGNAEIPGTIGSAVAILNEDDSFTFLTNFGGIRSARERLDGTGFNFAALLDSPDLVFYAGRERIDIDGSSQSFQESEVLVSESDFTVLRRGDLDPYSMFYPGVNPAGDDLSVPLLDIFPEVGTIDFDEIVDITAADGQIHLLLSGGDGLWLFAAPDPTQVPEPGTWFLLLTVLAGHSLRLQQR